VFGPMFGCLLICVTDQRVSRICGPLELRSAIQVVTVWVDHACSSGLMVFVQSRPTSWCYSHINKVWMPVLSLRLKPFNDGTGPSRPSMISELMVL